MFAINIYILSLRRLNSLCFFSFLYLLNTTPFELEEKSNLGTVWLLTIKRWLRRLNEGKKAAIMIMIMIIIVIVIIVTKIKTKEWEQNEREKSGKKVRKMARIWLVWIILLDYLSVIIAIITGDICGVCRSSIVWALSFCLWISVEQVE